MKRIPARAKVVMWGVVFRQSFREINKAKVVPAIGRCPFPDIRHHRENNNRKRYREFSNRTEESMNKQLSSDTSLPSIAVDEYNKAVNLIRQGRDAEALTCLSKLLDTHRDFVDAIALRGIVFFGFGRADKAIVCLHEALARDPGHPDALSHLAVIRLEQDDPDAAVALLEKALLRARDDSNIHSNLGLAYHEIKNFAAAREQFTAALDLDPANTHARAYLANLLLDIDDAEAHRWLTNFDTLVERTVLETPKGWPDMSAFLSDIVHTLQAEHSMKDEPHHRATVGGASSMALSGQRGSAIEALRDAFTTNAFAYAATRQDEAATALLGKNPKRFTTQMWGNILKSGGHQLTHNHPAGWISGVFYVSLPDVISAKGSGQNGWIEFGRTRPEYSHSDQVDTRTIRPKEGMMLIFPSYTWHRTLPFESAQPRISVAFDLLPAQA